MDALIPDEGSRYINKSRDEGFRYEQIEKIYMKSKSHKCSNEHDHFY